MVLPDETGTGVTPHRCAQRTLGAEPLWVVAGGYQQGGSSIDTDAVELEQATEPPR